RADIVTYPMDASLTGGLQLSNTVRVPALSGALEIVEGSLTFPTARFDLVDSQIEFPQERASIEPRINVLARGAAPGPDRLRDGSAGAHVAEGREHRGGTARSRSRDGRPAYALRPVHERALRTATRSVRSCTRHRRSVERRRARLHRT